MCAHVNATGVIMLAEIRRAELLEQAEHYRLVRQATGLNAGRGSRGIALRTELLALGARIGALRRRPELAKPIDLTPAPPVSETTSTA